MISFSLVLSCSALLFAPIPKPSDPKLNLAEFQKEREAQQTAILAKLQDDAIWKNPKKKQGLLVDLQVVQVLRNPIFIPVLVKHLTFKLDPIEGKDPKSPSVLEEEYPTVGVLEAIGLPAVPGLLTRLKEIDPEDKQAEGSLQQTLALHAIIAIYQVGGEQGKDLARQRIALEIKKCNEEEKDRLLNVLKHPALASAKEKK